MLYFSQHLKVEKPKEGPFAPTRIFKAVFNFYIAKHMLNHDRHKGSGQNINFISSALKEKFPWRNLLEIFRDKENLDPEKTEINLSATSHEEILKPIPKLSLILKRFLLIV